MFGKISFPSEPSFFAEWRTVYFEPIPKSGELIAILITTKDLSGTIEVFDALHPTVIDSLYGTKASSFNGYIKLIKANILKNNGESTLDGVTIGAWHTSQSDNIKGIVRQALYKTASLGSVALKGLFEQEDSLFENEQVDNRWSKRVKNAVLEIDSSYENAFDIKIPIRKDVKISCGFHTARYSAKFNVCTSQTITRMKSNLMDLQIFDSHNVSSNYDLIIQMPTDDNLQVPLKTLARMKENIELLREEVASKTHINIYTCDSEKEGAARIFEMLKAS
ncbi:MULTISPECIES: hypothetical protein [Acinetobacter]|uniref:hypothetical protein n=1 Tax=Acinetobacter TaxID=469 RepID=UPI00029AAA78|nr:MULTISPECIES: hypothetical protein [Acinetobacter]ENV76232.1 hypothetical protein F944_01703 [Acinetobacter ursingii DSM 16037 = CIP 107286]MCH2004075.1 hypothetical protein [Acinetobacter ursingii]MPW44836.1 hypothetical protein [Acinetobacter guerrae]QQT67260.1 hypothetical protein I6I52_06420 [Acinetobacter ursingii]